MQTKKVNIRLLWIQFEDVLAPRLGLTIFDRAVYSHLLRRFGRNSYRNLVSCCIECNTRKGDHPAPDHLRDLYRKGRLTPAELDAQLARLKDLAAGKHRPSLPSA